MKDGCLGCSGIETTPVCLSDGRTVCSWCPDHLRECEAREVLKMPIDKRREYLKKIEKNRGTAFIDEFKVLLTEIFNRSKSCP